MIPDEMTDSLVNPLCVRSVAISRILVPVVAVDLAVSCASNALTDSRNQNAPAISLELRHQIWPVYDSRTNSPMTKPLFLLTLDLAPVQSIKNIDTGPRLLHHLQDLGTAKLRNGEVSPRHFESKGAWSMRVERNSERRRAERDSLF